MSTDVSVLGYPTFNDIMQNYSSLDARARFVMPARVLDRTTPFIKMLPMVASNNILFNVGSRTDSLPQANFRMYDQGIKSVASKNIPITDPIALAEMYSEVDKDKWEIQNEPNVWRSDQDMNCMEGMHQLIESTVIYGNLTTNPGGFNGLSTRFNNLTSVPNGSSDFKPNVWNGGATSGNCTSAWMIEFDPTGFYGIYPPNTPAGLSVRDLGEDTAQQTDVLGSVGNMYKHQVLRSLLRWYIGIQVSDERCVQRIANINPTLLSSNNFDESIFIAAKNQLPRFGEYGTTAIFVNRDLKTQIDIRATVQKINAYTNFTANETDVFGKSVTKFQNIPIYVAEKLLSTETPVSA